MYIYNTVTSNFSMPNLVIESFYDLNTSSTILAMFSPQVLDSLGLKNPILTYKLLDRQAIKPATNEPLNIGQMTITFTIIGNPEKWTLMNNVITQLYPVQGTMCIACHGPGQLVSGRRC